MCHTREGAVLAGGSGGGGKGALPRAGRGGRRHSLEVIFGRFLGAIWEVGGRVTSHHSTDLTVLIEVLGGPSVRGSNRTLYLNVNRLVHWFSV